MGKGGNAAVKTPAVAGASGKKVLFIRDVAYDVTEFAGRYVRPLHGAAPDSGPRSCATRAACGGMRASCVLSAARVVPSAAIPPHQPVPRIVRPAWIA